MNAIDSASHIPAHDLQVLFVVISRHTHNFRACAHALHLSHPSILIILLVITVLACLCFIYALEGIHVVAQSLHLLGAHSSLLMGIESARLTTHHCFYHVLDPRTSGFAFSAHDSLETTAVWALLTMLG